MCSTVFARSLTTALLATTALSPLALRPAQAQSLPTGASVAYGAVGFQRSSGTLTINQSSQSAIVNYQSFSIGQRNTVTFNQPNASSVILNRVTGTAPSTIAGHLNANGQVYLVNPNGIAITKTGVVKVGGGFVASSLGMSDADFKAGRRQFRGNGSSARVSNAGTITIGRGGYAALIGGEVRNSGSIAVPMGRVGLGSGEMATLDVSGDGFLQVALPTTRSGTGALVSNSGLIAAEGGTVVVDAATARAAAREAINISGTIDAHSISGHNGSIVLGGGDGGRVTVSGHLSVASRHGTGGSITITGHAIALRHAHLDASGKTGGGTVRIGGDLHGGGTLQHAGTVTIDAKSVIRADATGKGNGGSVVVWSDEATAFAGLISAEGGAQGGDGGAAEVSSHGVLDYTGTTVLTAAKGAMGTLLLDPYNVTISSGTDSNTTLANGTYTPSGTSVISNTELQSQLASANVTITTGAAGSAGTDAGNITVAAPVTWSAATTLTLTAANAIAIDAPITITGAGGLALNSGTTMLSGGAITLPLISFGSSAAITFAANQTGQALSINGAGYTLVYTIAQLQAIGLSSNTALAQSLDATGYTGFTPIGETTPFTGTFDGLGNTISNLTISAGGTYAGLFGQVGVHSPTVVGNNGTIANVGLVGGSVQTSAFFADVGGLVGYNAGVITQSYVTGTAGAAKGGSSVGGLVGYNKRGTVMQSYATGAVSGSSSVGGLVGDNSGEVLQSYATGAVSGNKDLTNVGGLVGYNDGGDITQSYAVGTVTGGSSSLIGGLVGKEYGTVNNSYYDADTTGQAAGPQNDSSVGLTTAGLAAALPTGFDPTVWANAGNQTTPYLLANPGPVFLATDTASAATSTTPTFYTPILSVAALQAIGSTGNYVLGQNLDATGVTGFTPIGETTAFAGTFDGLGFTILKLTITSTGSYAGLFGQVDTGGTVENVGLVGGSVTDTASGASVGGLAGGNAGTIMQAYATGTATGGDSSYVGGLVGVNAGTITQAYATGAVGGGGNAAVGGLAGANLQSITQVYATGATTGGAGTAVGGLVGENAAGTITQAYATGTVSGAGGTNSDVGGLVGVNSSAVTQAYAMGAVSGGPGSTVGGLVGSSTGSITNGYYDVATTGQAAGSQSDGSVGLSTAGLAGSLSALGFDPMVWGNAGNQTTPYLLANPGPVYLGTDTSTTPTAYTPILSVSALQAIGSTGNYVLAQNLDATGVTGFVPIGESAAFTGTFNGLGFAIANLTISSTGSYAGLFGQVGTGGVVENVGMVGGSVTDTATSGSGGADVGGLVGSVNAGGLITQAYATGAATGGGAANVGGLVGTNAGTISQAYATGAVAGGTFSSVGGLVGNNSGRIGQAYATGTVSGSGPGNVGGLVGINFNMAGIATISLSYATGVVSGGTNAGGLVGNNGGTITSSYWDTTTDNPGITIVTASGPATGDTNTGVGSGNSSGVSPVTTQQLSNATTLTALNSNGVVWGNAGNQTTPYLLANPGPVYLGTDSSAMPTAYQPILTVTQLQAMGVNPAGNYVLGQNINATGVTGFVPIGESTPFTGTFNGLGFAISNLTISSSAAYAGLFGQVGTGGTVENVGMVGGSVTDKADYAAVGGLIGSDSGTIMQAYATGAVHGGGSGAYVGGLVGTANSDTIVQSYATGAVTGLGAGTSLGGLVGFDYAGQITQSYATGRVTGGANAAAGGLAGYSNGTITQSYATGAAGGGTNADVGGLVGTNAGSVTLSYATGAVTDGGSGSDAGGLVGYDGIAGSVTQSYWDTTTNVPTITGVGGGSTSGVTPLTTAGLAGATTLAALNGNGTVWGNAGNQTTPYLLANPGRVYLGTDTSSTPTPYTPVLSVAALQAIGPTGNYVLAQNLDATGVTGFVPIGESTPFTGTFDGLGFAISNLTISSGAAYAGLFGQVGTGGVVENVGMVGGSVTDLANYADVGGLVGYNAGTITRAYATGAVTGGSGGYVSAVGADGSITETQTFANVGGLVGSNSGTITQAYATGAATGDTLADIGGLVGNNGGGTIALSYAMGNVTGGSVANVGGLVGDNSVSGTITQAHATGAIAESGGDAGGLAGENAGTITLSSATGNITGGQSVSAGGLVGYANGGQITLSDATGTVGGGDYADVGGLVGFADGGTITLSYATGNVTGGFAARAGGLVGDTIGGEIKQAYATGSVTGGGGATVGGLVGYNHGSGGKFEQVYATGAVESGNGSSRGGLVGSIGNGTITAGYYDAATTGQAAGPQSDGSVGVSTQVLANATTLAALNSAGTVWGNAGNQTTPYLLNNPGPVILATDTASVVAGTTPTYYTPVLSLAGLEAINANLAGNYALVQNIDATGMIFTTGVIAGGDASGNLPTPFSGALEGLGHTVGNLTIAGGANDYVGLIGYSTGSVRDFGVVDGSVSGYARVGDLVGANNGTVTRSYATGAVIGDDAGSYSLGGLVGRNGGTITQSYALGAVTGVSGSENVGGLAGYSSGAINGSYAIGAVTGGSGSAFVGGLVGISYSAISSSYATGAVSGSSNIGGLVGSSSGPISQASASGVVTGTGAGLGTFQNVGGLAGLSSNAITNSYATGAVNGSGTAASIYFGGLVGQNYGGTISRSYATGNVSVAGTGQVSIAAGGLVGANFGTVTLSYATGSVAGTATGTGQEVAVGGLAGYSGGSISQTFATGAATAATTTASQDASSVSGSLIGDNAAAVTHSYATGAVSSIGVAPNVMGGLIGENEAGATVTASAYDSSTTGQSQAIGQDGNSQGGNIAALSTAQLQGTQALPAGTTLALGAAFAGGAASPGTNGSLSTQPGLYPYLAAFFPGGVQAVSGFAYKDAGTTAAASGANGAVTVSLDGNLGQIAQVMTGANGYYYAFAPAGTMAAGGSLLVSTSANTTTGATNSATLTSATAAAGNQTGVNLYGNAVTVPTGATLLSQAPSLSAAQASAETAAGTDTTAAAAVALATGQGFVATGAGFTIDQAVTTPSTFIVQTAAGAPLTVAQAITIQSGGALGLLSGGSLAIDADVTAQGAVPVTLAAATSTVPGTTTSVLDLSFAQGHAITFTDATGNAVVAPVTGQALTINGTGYTLLYTLTTSTAATGNGPDSGTSDVAGIDANTSAGGDAGNYALATNLTGTGTAANPQFTSALVGSGNNSFIGTFAGLGHTISNLTIGSIDVNSGLFGQVGSGGIVENVGLVGGSVSGNSNTGGLAGSNDGSITQSYATGSVNGFLSTGGLVGYNDGSITQSYATGSVNGFLSTGGLVGANYSGSITQSYATGAVGGLGNMGGLVGGNSYGSITQSYATGAVGGIRGIGGSNFGGLVGENNGTIAASAYDASTTGLPGIGDDHNDQSGNIATLTTAALQSTATTNPFLVSGSSSATGFTGGAAGGQNGVYPYLTAFFPNGVQAITGTAAAGTQVGLYAGGTLLGGGTVSTGANGYVYQAVAAGTLPASGVKIGALVTPSGSTTATGLVYTDAGTVTNNVLPLGAIATGVVSETTAEATYSALQTDVAATFGSVTLPTSANAATSITATGASFTLDLAVTAGASYSVNATGGPLTLSAAINASGQTVTLSSAGTISQNGGTITAGTLTGASNGAASFTQSTNQIGTLGGLTASSGSITLYDDTNLTNQGAVQAGGTVLIAVDGTFTNASGATVQAGTGSSFTIYTQDPTNPTGTLPGDTFTGLTGTNYYNDAYSFTSGQFASAVPTGNHFVYDYTASLAPTLGGSASKTYDGTTTAATTNLTVTASGLANAGGIADSATFSLTGATYDTSNAGTGKTVTATGIAFANNPNNYVLAATSASAAVGTITPAALTITATNQSKTYGQTAALGTTAFTETGLVTGTGDTISGVTLASDGAASTANVAGSPYAITASNAQGMGLSNYTITYANGALTVNQAPLTITATNQSKTYGQTANLGTTAFTETGLVTANGDTISGVTLASDGAAPTANVAGLPYAITASNAQGMGLSNYTISYANGGLTVNPAALTITALDQSKVYGQTAALGTTGFTTQGLVSGNGNNDNVTAVTLTSDGATASANVGPSPYAITASNAQGSGLTNYQITYVAGQLAVTPAPLTVTGAKSYDATTGFATGQLAVAGAVNGEHVRLTGGTGASSSAEVGTYAGSPLSNLAISVSGGNMLASNYSLPATGTLTIGKAPITVAGASGVPALPVAATDLGSTAVRALEDALAASQIISSGLADPAGLASPLVQPIDASGYEIICVKKVCTIVPVSAASKLKAKEIEQAEAR